MVQFHQIKAYFGAFEAVAKKGFCKSLDSHKVQNYSAVTCLNSVVVAVKLNHLTFKAAMLVLAAAL